MPAKPLPLQPVPPSRRPSGIHPELWAFPQRLADAANSRGKSQQELAKAAKVAQSSISRWMHYKVKGLRVRDVLSLERALGLPKGWLLSEPEVPPEEEGVPSMTPIPGSAMVPRSRR